MENCPDLVRVFPGLSDELAQSRQVQHLRDRLNGLVDHLAFERQLADQIDQHKAKIIKTNPVLSLIFSYQQNNDDQLKVPVADQLKTSFMIDDDSPTQSTCTLLPTDLIDNLATYILVKSHPDRGMSNELSSEIGGILNRRNIDPDFSIARALNLTYERSIDGTVDAQDSFYHRYVLTLLVDNLKPVFDSREAAINRANYVETTIEKQVCVEAIFKTLHLVLGGNNTWAEYLQKTMKQLNRHETSQLVDFKNKFEKLQMDLVGSSLASINDDAKQAVNNVLGQIWSSLCPEGNLTPDYQPPYIEYIKKLLPLMKQLTINQ